MSRTRWAAAAVLCLAAAVTGCAPARNTLPVVTGAFGTDPLISLPAGKPPGALVVRRLGQGPGPVVRPSSPPPTADPGRRAPGASRCPGWREPGRRGHQADRAPS